MRIYNVVYLYIYEYVVDDEQVYVIGYNYYVMTCVYKYRRVYVLIDARHGIRQSDITMLKLLTESRLTHQV